MVLTVRTIVALVQFFISAGDTILRDHLDNPPKNATYTPLNIQNQVIHVLGDDDI